MMQDAIIDRVVDGLIVLGIFVGKAALAFVGL